VEGIMRRKSREDGSDGEEKDPQVGFRSLTISKFTCLILLSSQSPLSLVLPTNE
jgi:hypothetical protein